MPTCPAGHPSSARARCAVCGLPTAQPPPTVPGAGAPEETCPDCAAVRDGRFCEECGHDFAAADRTEASPLPLTPPPAPRSADHDGTTVLGTAPDAPRPGAVPEPAHPTWWAIVCADPAYYRAMADRSVLDPASVEFPAHAPQRRMPLNRARIRIGRRSLRTGIHPEIDLAGPPEDPAVSHTHAVLIARPGGGWALIDEGSTNGTTLNGTADAVPANTEVPLNEADRIYVGAWTVIALHRQRG
ncbi:FHA domain-containing protein [Streptomonospora salina]|uniref:FHA domain-containing protein n=1 Tax=Streptomonospora salina TaxID=104205 RepID=A0A841E758_9ACTN|nr:FHA domain-containing protein [Streptomonospora salina]MBB5998294.1 hypothetical protein [Streptomonospora salina]